MISQFQLHRPTPLGYCGAFARLVSPRGGTIANFEQPFDFHLPTPEKFLTCMWFPTTKITKHDAQQDLLG